MTKRKRDRFKHSLKDLLAKFGVASRNELASLLISRELRELERTGSAEPLAQAVAMQNALFGIQQKPSEPPPRA